MTRSEFTQKFNSAFNNEADKIFAESSINKILEPYVDSSGNVPSKKIIPLVLVESTEITKKVLKSVLENVLQFDD
ncbi:MAG: hypothetical protein K2O16_03290 [Lachnospiraceae bacterium]|nr:hypothetical protein [Lachnospiraceae bacterium]